MNRKKKRQTSWSVDQYEQYMQKNFPTRIAVSHANVEPDEGPGSQKKDPSREMASPVRIRVHHIRVGTFDCENLYSKSLIDGIVSTGILQDDKYGIVNSFEASGGRPGEDDCDNNDN